MDVTKNSEEPEWLEKRITGELRLWQIMFICLAAITCLSEYLPTYVLLFVLVNPIVACVTDVRMSSI